MENGSLIESQAIAHKMENNTLRLLFADTTPQFLIMYRTAQLLSFLRLRLFCLVRSLNVKSFSVHSLMELLPFSDENPKLNNYNFMLNIV